MMNPVFKKLNYKDQSQILVINTPESFRSNMENMTGLTQFVEDLADVQQIEFMMAFVTRQAEINKLVPHIAPKLKGDALVWFCYPKGSSKKYKCDFNRDTGWQILGVYDLEPVRMVAIDADWSALRFRKVQFIKKITRKASFALTKEAKKRTTNKD